MTDTEREICKIYLEDLADLNKSHSCNEYKMLMRMLDAEPCEDTISRQAAIDVIDAILPVEPMKNEYTQGITFGAALAIEYVKQLPSAQPERKTATWLIRKWGGDAKCSNCGRYFKDVYDMENYDNFCRHCGTQMKGIEQHE